MVLLVNPEPIDFLKTDVFFVWDRVYIDRGSAYVFITRSIQKSSQLLSTLKVFDPHEAKDSCSLRR